MRNITHSWDNLQFFQGSDFANVVTFLKEEQAEGKLVLPEFINVLAALGLTPLERVKVVILGQDPYPNPKHAHGLAFSVPDEVKPFPDSLRNIFTELVSDLNISFPMTGNLTQWAEQGVLLLNTILTVEAGKRGSHAGKGWEILTAEIIEAVNASREHVVFILWGKPAALKARYIDESKHLVLTSPHPSPLSAHTGFFGSKPFSKTNAYLVTHQIEPIDWQLK